MVLLMFTQRLKHTKFHSRHQRVIHLASESRYPPDCETNIGSICYGLYSDSTVCYYPTLIKACEKFHYDAIHSGCAFTREE